MSKTTAITKPLSKSALLAELSENTDLTKKQVAHVMDELASVIERHIKKRGAGTFTLPGLLKIKTVKKPAVKAHERPDPLNKGQMMQVKAKPATMKVKVLPLKKLKEMPL